MRILVVEDEKEISDIIKSKLEKEKYTVDTIYDGFKYLSELENQSIQIVEKIFQLILLRVK